MYSMTREHQGHMTKSNRLRRSAINRFIGRTHPLLLVYVLSEDLVRKKHSPPLKQAMLKSSSRNVL